MGLALATTPDATVGFSTPVAPSALCRHGKEKVVAFSDKEDNQIVIDMDAAMRAVEGNPMVGHVLSPYPADHKAAVNALKSPWQLR